MRVCLTTDCPLVHSAACVDSGGPTHIYKFSSHSGLGTSLQTLQKIPGPSESILAYKGWAKQWGWDARLQDDLRHKHIRSCE